MNSRNVRPFTRRFFYMSYSSTVASARRYPFPLAVLVHSSAAAQITVTSTPPRPSEPRKVPAMSRCPSVSELSDEDAILDGCTKNPEHPPHRAEGIGDPFEDSLNAAPCPHGG